jgi:hypothetical protein
MGYKIGHIIKGKRSQKNPKKKSKGKGLRESRKNPKKPIV